MFFVHRKADQREIEAAIKRPETISSVGTTVIRMGVCGISRRSLRSEGPSRFTNVVRPVAKWKGRISVAGSPENPCSISRTFRRTGPRRLKQLLRRGRGHQTLAGADKQVRS